MRIDILLLDLVGINGWNKNRWYSLAAPEVLQ